MEKLEEIGRNSEKWGEIRRKREKLEEMREKGQNRKNIGEKKENGETSERGDIVTNKVNQEEMGRKGRIIEKYEGIRETERKKRNSEK